MDFSSLFNIRCSGSVQCALFGEYVDMVNDCVAAQGDQVPVAIVQLIKVKTYLGNA